MPQHIAFLRAINLGAKRKFPKDDIRRCVESLPATEVETYINTGNVRLSSTLRSRARLEASLEEIFEADRDFEVPTISFQPAELRQVAEDAAQIDQELSLAQREGEPAPGHYVSLLKEAPTDEAVAALQAIAAEGEHCVVRGRAAHIMLEANYHSARFNNTLIERHLGTATNRNLTVITALAEKWC